MFHSQANVQIFKTHLAYNSSLITRIYGPRGLTAKYLAKFKPDEQCKIVYRNLIRLRRYLTMMSHFKEVYGLYIQARFREDYHEKRAILNPSLPRLKNKEILRRMANSVNFVSNACAEPLGEDNMEFRILRGIILHESSKIKAKIDYPANILSVRDFSEHKLMYQALGQTPQLPPDWLQFLKTSQTFMRAPGKVSSTKRALIPQVMLSVLRYEKNKEYLNETARLIL
ncbi:hypothetical protein OGAPHI_002744 [Ogataea philodendri]|uniref:Increased recombination centers protein 19 n=1 Tax=Ogataea philodendri TaxID=1378263 RepID=A0A9P8T7Z7_9ASCO|nr:uncharacterized protein OGAPHI_002744 [Ogataea philodendri]KAH3668989.1 hypothetical protein OGAPHI_002744 [Ogataea philodendri]